MCCSSLASAVNVAAIIATMRHLLGLGIGFFVCKSIDATDRTDLEKDIYDRLLVISGSQTNAEASTSKIEEVIFPWAVTLTTLAAVMIVASFSMMYANLRDGTQCLAVWLFLSILDTVISPTSAGIYTFKFIENYIMKSRDDYDDKLREISIFSGVMVVYYLLNLVLIGITWKRYVQIKQDNEQKLEISFGQEPYTISMNNYSNENGEVPQENRRGSFNAHEFLNSSRSRSNYAPDSVLSEYQEDNRTLRPPRVDDRWRPRYEDSLSPMQYHGARRLSDNASGLSDYEDGGRSYYDNIAMDQDMNWDYAAKSGYTNSEVSYGRRMSSYPENDELGKRRFSVYPANEGGSEANMRYYHGREPPTQRKSSTYYQNDEYRTRRHSDDMLNEGRPNQRIVNYPPDMNQSRRNSAYFGDRSMRY